MSFDFGAFSEEPEPGADAPLTWRDDPEKTLSDWTIIVSKNDGSTATYHVHKNMLAAGSRPSDYFKSVFRNSGMEEGNSQTTRLTLEDSAVHSFPTYLDFVYTGELIVKKSADYAINFSPTALLHLATYLRCRTRPTRRLGRS